jgi:CRISPR-associated endonuclease Cas1/CRISPR-associated protein Cas4
MQATSIQEQDPALLEVPPLLPARMLNEFAYCPRLFFLEWIQGEWNDSEDTVQGRHVHRRVDKETGTLPEQEKMEEEPDFTARSVYLSAPGERLVAKMDIVEANGSEVCPVDYKKGTMPDIPGGVWEPEKVQLCAQGLVLEENGYPCTQGMIWFAGSRQKVPVVFDDELRTRTRELIGQAFETLSKNVIPEPLVGSRKCPKCSLVEICLPDETCLCKHHTAVETARRLVPARQDRLPLYVQDQGAYLGLSGECLQIRKKKKVCQESKLKDISSVSLFGNIQISTQALRELSSRNIPVSWFSYGGWFCGYMRGLPHKNVELRRSQYRRADDAVFCVGLAGRLVQAKIMNCRTMVRRNHPEPDQGILSGFKRFALKSLMAGSLKELLGVEGTAASLYFSQFKDMIKKGNHDFVFKDRNRRPPRDPVNCLLSYGYSLLTNDFTATLAKLGLDPYLGFYHQTKYGKPALSLDLMEEFRPLVVDSVVLSCLNKNILQEDDFQIRNLGVFMKPKGKKKFLQEYARRMDGLITHPVFKYRISYRQVLEVQIRLFCRFLQGELDAYPLFITR